MDFYESIIINIVMPPNKFAKEKLPDGKKRCMKCEEIKDVDDFKKRNNKPISQCKTCTNKRNAELKRLKREKVKQDKIDKGDIILPKNDNNKVCPYCKSEKSKDNFRKNRKKCLDCEREHGKKYRKSNIGKKKSKKWLDDNSDKMKKLQSDWYQNNKEKVNKKFRERCKNDPEFKIKYVIKSRLNRVLNNHDIGKDKRTMKYVGCTEKLFCEWMEYCFDKKKSFEKHGEYWHMDHVIPVNTFDLSIKNNYDICFYWGNYSPLKGTDNMTKKDSIDKKQLKKHLKKLEEFAKENKIEVPNDYLELCARHLKSGNPLRA